MPFGDIDEDAPAPRRTALDFIRDMQAQRKAAAVRTVSLRDPERPEFELICEVPTDLDQQLDVEARAEKTAKSKDAPAEQVVIACMTLARWCRQVRVRGQGFGDGDGSVFADPELQETLGAPNAWRAVRQLFITDGDRYDDTTILRLMSALQRSAGLNRLDSVVVGDEPDPT